MVNCTNLPKSSFFFLQPHPYNRKLQTVGAAFPPRRGTKGRCAVWQRKSPRAKSRAAGTLPKLLLLALLLLIGAHLLNLRQEISRAEAEKQTLSAQLEQQQRENDSLSSALEKADDPGYLQELAREQLDMVSPGEKVFYDVSN